MCVCVFHLSSLVKMEKSSQNLVEWTVADVASYFIAAGFPEQAAAFRTQVRLATRPEQQLREHVASSVTCEMSVIHHLGEELTEKTAKWVLVIPGAWH